MILNKKLGLVYLSGFLIAIHYAAIAYVNSSLLGQFVGNSLLNVLYVLGAILSIIFLSLAPLFLRKYGNIHTLLFFVTLEFIAIFSISATDIPLLIMILFLIHQGTISVLYFCLDVNMEQEIKAEGTTGIKRGTFLTVQNTAWVLSPLIFGTLAIDANFNKVYLISAFTLAPLFLITVFFFKNIKNSETRASNIKLALSSLFSGGDKSRIVGIQFVLNFFYAWMIIYMPLLLNKEIGFDWDKIGFIFTIMLLPFLIFEIPAGFLGDKKTGEKEILITGLSVMLLATLFIPMINAPIFWIWALTLFATRTGASLVEIGSESYFFKHVKEEDTGFISLFRMARPLSFIIAPLIAIPINYFFSYSVLFYFLAFFIFVGFFFIPKVDTK